MQHKYLIAKDDKKNKLRISELATVDSELKKVEITKLEDDMFSLLCEEIYDADTMKSLIAKGKEDLIAGLRTRNMYPIGPYAEKIAEAIMDLYASEENKSAELRFDDNDIILASREAASLRDEIAKTSIELDEILESDSEVNELEDPSKPVVVSKEESELE